MTYFKMMMMMTTTMMVLLLLLLLFTTKTCAFLYGCQPFKDEVHTALYKDPVPTAL